MKEPAAIGFDIAKNVFQLQGIDSKGKIVLHRKTNCHDFLTIFKSVHSRPIGMEACSCTHH